MENITAPGMRSIPYLDLTADVFLNRLTILFGGSFTGKTVLIKYIMHMLKPNFNECIIVAPTNDSNGAYTGIVPNQLIHSTLSTNPIKSNIGLLEIILERQIARTSIANCGNNLDSLKRLAAMVPHDRTQTDSIIKKGGELRSKLKDPIKRSELDMSIDSKLKTAYQKIIKDNTPALLKMGLNPTQMDVIKGVNINPNLLLVLDDVAAELKKYTSSDVVRQLFYQGRHANITVLLSAQDQLIYRRIYDVIVI